ncbi:MAG TPA: response regulator, partial [Gammaproteobacteria bacterium]|nr:response regulator [Gammaproteobacteria bacterium]
MDSRSGEVVMPQDTCILVATQQEETRASLCKILNQAGMGSLIEVSDGQAAIQKLRDSSSINLLITDIHLPYIDGWRLARMVRSGVFRCAKTLPIIAVSATFTERIAETT